MQYLGVEQKRSSGYLIHIGNKNSGRYPRGSGENPNQHTFGSKVGKAAKVGAGSGAATGLLSGAGVAGLALAADTLPIAGLAISPELAFLGIPVAAVATPVAALGGAVIAAGLAAATLGLAKGGSTAVSELKNKYNNRKK